MKRVDLTNKTFSRLTVVSLSDTKGCNYSLLWVCLCSCGKYTTVSGSNLKSGHTKSCGCFSSENIFKHGDSDTRFYKIWKKILQRCNNPKDSSYKNYGGRGIEVCQDWYTFINFKRDMKDGYSDNLTIERVDFNKGYNKENCTWATYKEQAKNKRTNHKINSPWGLLTVTEVAEKVGVHASTMFYRVKMNWPKHRLFLPPNNTSI